MTSSRPNHGRKHTYTCLLFFAFLELCKSAPRIQASFIAQRPVTFQNPLSHLRPCIKTKRTAGKKAHYLSNRHAGVLHFSGASGTLRTNTKTFSLSPDLDYNADKEKAIIPFPIEGAILSLPRHSNNAKLNDAVSTIENALQKMHRTSLLKEGIKRKAEKEEDTISFLKAGSEEPLGERVFANSYVDLGNIDTIGFDFDYTLVTYSTELLSLIYDMALDRLVDKGYPSKMLNELNGKFDPFFSIRGLAADKETGWICHLSYTHKVAVAWEGREKVSSEDLINEYSRKRSLSPSERKKRLKPLNDLFSMAECCLIADVIQFFKDREIPFYPRSCTEDILNAIEQTHSSFDFHRIVASDPAKYFEPKPHLASVLNSLRASGKRLIFASNTPFWYVNAGMTQVIGPQWREMWDAVIVSAGKPNFYTDRGRPFREVSTKTGRIEFKKIERLEPGKVYTEGCLRELIKCFDVDTPEVSHANELESQTNAGYTLATPRVLYVGDSLFTDLVDAKHEFGWTTAAIVPEVGFEFDLRNETNFALSQQTIDLLVYLLRQIQDILGNQRRSEEDDILIDQLEKLVSLWRSRQVEFSGETFGSVFRARFQPSLFAHCLRRYCDLYMSGVDCLRHSTSLLPRRYEVAWPRNQADFAGVLGF